MIGTLMEGKINGMHVPRKSGEAWTAVDLGKTYILKMAYFQGRHGKHFESVKWCKIPLLFWSFKGQKLSVTLHMTSTSQHALCVVSSRTSYTGKVLKLTSFPA